MVSLVLLVLLVPRVEGEIVSQLDYSHFEFQTHFAGMDNSLLHLALEKVGANGTRGGTSQCTKEASASLVSSPTSRTTTG